MMQSIRYSAKLIAGLGIAAALASCGSSGDSGTVPSSTPESFSRVDRTGQPAIATALLVNDCPGGAAPCNSATTVLDAGGNPINPGAPGNPFNDQRDQFNRGDPVTDGQFAFTLTVGPQVRSLQNIHFEAGPALRALGLITCSTEPAGGAADRTQVNIDVCVAQAAPAVIPDVITFNFAAAAGWPNGRHYDDPVVDRLLAVALLNLSAGGQTINTLVGVINTWNGPTGNASACVAPPAVPPAVPCPGGDETGTPSPLVFPYLRPANP